LQFFIPDALPSFDRRKAPDFMRVDIATPAGLKVNFSQPYVLETEPWD